MDSDEEDAPVIAQKYQKDAKVGEGTYAVVYRGTEIATSRTVAIKKIKMGQFKDGMDLTAIREVKYLQEIRHPNVIELIDVYSYKTNLNLVLEYLESTCSPYSRHTTSFVKPSSLMSSREKPLPRFGIVRACPRCNERITSVHEEIPGPKASRWHKKCLSCTGCNKLLDSGAAVHEDSSTGRLYPWCTTCSLSKRDRRCSTTVK
ncbi:Putative Cyclin-dependent protein kinase [Rhizopus microsporus]|nr:Putative Cyclin-dependent protein kinase [Rhizopus microsporus]